VFFQVPFVAGESWFDYVFRIKAFHCPIFVMFVGLATFTFISVKSQTHDLLELVQLSGLSTTDLIKESTHYSMLINRKEDIHQIFQNFSKMPEFEVIRIYENKSVSICAPAPFSG
jgi:hypothetical protein